MIVYKLTDARDQTRGGTQWGEGVTHEASGEGGLCGPGWIHCYDDPLLAVLMNPIHVNWKTMHLWEAEAELDESDGGLKFGTRRLTTLRRIPLPKLNTEQQVRLAIRVALEVYREPGFVAWTQSWLDGTDRSEGKARAVARAMGWPLERQSAAWAARAAARAAMLAPVANVAMAVALAVAWATRAATTPLDLKALVAQEAIQKERRSKDANPRLRPCRLPLV